MFAYPLSMCAQPGFYCICDGKDCISVEIQSDMPVSLINSTPRYCPPFGNVWGFSLLELPLRIHAVEPPVLIKKEGDPCVWYRYSTPLMLEDIPLVFVKGHDTMRVTLANLGRAPFQIQIPFQPGNFRLVAALSQPDCEFNMKYQPYTSQHILGQMQMDTTQLNSPDGCFRVIMPEPCYEGVYLFCRSEGWVLTPIHLEAMSMD